MFGQLVVGLVILNAVTIHDVVAKKPLNKTFSFAIIPMAGFEKYYLDVTLLNLVRPPFQPPNEKMEEKKLICEAIFRNPVMFDLQGVDALDATDPQIHEELRTKYPDLFNKFYKAPSVAVLNQVHSQWLNNYRPYNFSVAGTIVTEFPYPCLTRNRASQNIEIYFVSGEYRLPRADVIASHERKVSTRFVFQRKNEEDEVVLLALTDTPPEHTIPPHHRYCERTELTNERSKALCDIPDIQRIRLCANLFGAKNHTETDRYDAPPVAPECTELKIVIRGKETLEYKDTALECQVKRIATDSNGPSTYYVSRGLRAHQYFVTVREENSELYVLKEHFYAYILKIEE